MLSSTQLAKINNETKIRGVLSDEEQDRLKKFRQFKLGGKKEKKKETISVLSTYTFLSVK